MVKLSGQADVCSNPVGGGQLSSTDIDQVIIEAVQNHYKEKDSPYYLAELGEFFRSQDISIPDGVRFKDYLKSRFHGSLVVVQDANYPAKNSNRTT